jgi:hypothetical protein
LFRKSLFTRERKYLFGDFFTARLDYFAKFGTATPTFSFDSTQPTVRFE